MSNRVTGKTLKTAAIVGLFAGATALSGCSSLGGLGFDRTATGSVSAAAPMNTAQAMPRTLVPPENIGGGSGPALIGANMGNRPMSAQPLGSVSTEDLPVLTSSANGSNQMMPAAQPLSPVPATTTLASAP